MHRRTWIGTMLLGAAPGAARSAGSALARPSAEQRAWQDMELEMFIHFAPATWQDAEYDNHNAPPHKLHPHKLDVAQWVEAARSMGAGQLIFVAKHTGGFCWWQTQTSSYGVKEMPWRGGKGDVMRDLAEQCRRQRVRLGVYLSPQDTVFGAKVGGRCGSPEAQERYNAVYRRQLTELLSRYGEISEVWFDGSLAVEVGDILRRHAPRAMVFQGPHATIRWVGNEDGIAPYPAWNAVPAAVARSGVATGKDGTPEGTVWLPVECDARIRSTWFWNTRNAPTLKSVDQLMAMYYRSVGHGGVLLLNNTPDPTGLIPEADMKRTAEFGAEVRRRFDQSLAETKGSGEVVELKLATPGRIDHAVSMEAIEQGERIREYTIEGWTGESWRELVRGSAIGHKKIDAFPALEVSGVRLRVLRAAGRPTLRRLAVYYAGARGDAGAASGAVYAVRVVKQWGPTALAPDWTTWELDLTPHCSEAGQYEVDFVNTGGSGLRVRSAVLVHGGAEAPEFIRPAGRRNAYQVNITGLGVRIVLRVVVRAGRGADSYGQVSIRRAGV